MKQPGRLTRFHQSLPAQAAIVTSNLNRYYLSGFLGTAGTLLVTKDKVFYLADGRYFEAVSQKVPFAKAVLVKSKGWDELAALCAELDIGQLAFEDLEMTVASYRALEKAMPGVSLVGLADALPRQRAIKDEQELSLIQKAQSVTDRAYQELLNFIRAGVTEREVAHRLEELMAGFGGQGLAFDTIAVAGTHSSQPHGRPSDYVLADGDFLTLDFGAAYEGYCSDMTRTVAIGHATDEMRLVYGTVLEAQQRAIEMIAAGVSCREVDALARSVMQKQGFEQYFVHSLGHSFGMEIHEQPGLSQASEQTREAGMVMTVEPGIYLPGRFGVRIEDDVFVTQTGCINLTASPKELLIL